MTKKLALIAFLGMQDPYPDQGDEPGPVLALLLEAERRGRPFDEAWLFCAGASILERARDLERECRSEYLRVRVLPQDFPLKDVIDYAEIWNLLGARLHAIGSRAPERDWTFLLDSGTPQMKTCLFLAARSGFFPAELVQGIPPRFSGGAYKARSVRIEGLPRILLEHGFRQPVLEGSPPLEEPCVLFQTGESTGATAGREAAWEDEFPAGGLAGGGIVVSSPAFAAVHERALQTAKYDNPVLILGETGCGKTLLARTIHTESRRAEQPFVEANCAAFAPGMAASELFGHLRGAFTGADRAFHIRARCDDAQDR